MAEETIITLLLAGISLSVSLIVLGLTIKRDALNKDILRERRLLEEAYGPLKGKIRRMAVLDLPESTISVNKNIIEEIIDIRNRFEYEFSKELRVIIDYLISQLESYESPGVYKEKTKSNSSLRPKRRPKVYLKKFPMRITNAKEFKSRLSSLVKERFDQLDRSLNEKIKIQKNFWRFSFWVIFGR